MTGTLAISGSAAIRFRYRVIAASPSSNASSILISMTAAPPRTCWRATSTASSYRSSRISRANFLEPVTLVRSPIIRKLESDRRVNASWPLSLVSGGTAGTSRGAAFSAAWAIAAIYSGVVPQQPPMMLTQRFSRKAPICWDISFGVWSKPPNSFGSPALG